jgi:hypothetical protein
VEDDEAGDASSHSVAPLKLPGGLALSDSERAGALADSLEVLFQSVVDPSDPAFTEMVDVEMSAYEYAPASEPTLTTPSEVIKAIKGLKVCKAPGPSDIRNWVLKYLPILSITFLTNVFNAVIRRQCFSPELKQA